MDSRFDALRVCNRNDCDDYEVDDDEAINGEFVVFLFVFTQALLSDEVFVSLFVQFPITTITAEVWIWLAGFDACENCSQSNSD